MESVYIPVEEDLMVAELYAPEGNGPFHTLVWIADPSSFEPLPDDEAVLLIRRPVGHPLWFAGICDELRIQEFYTKPCTLRVDLPIVPPRFVPDHPFRVIEGIYGIDVKRCFPGNELS